MFSMVLCANPKQQKLVFQTLSNQFIEVCAPHNGLSRDLKCVRAQSLVKAVDSETLWNDVGMLAVARVSDTPGHKAVQQWIIRQFDADLWSLTEDSFVDRTPLGERRFANLIFTEKSDVDDEREPFQRLVLAAHYDSKYFSSMHFTGATDSAVPCVYLIHIARMLGPLVRARRAKRASSATSRSVRLQIVFFDGEEAFADWTSTDSLYGSRHLAQSWQSTGELESVHLLTLFDLMGHADMQFAALDTASAAAFDVLVHLERRLAKLDSVVASLNPPTRRGGA
jgi:glutaminyl-peptide cyclotransferase